MQPKQAARQEAISASKGAACQAGTANKQPEPKASPQRARPHFILL